MSTETRTGTLVSSESTTYELATGGLFALSVVGLVVGALTLATVVPVGGTVAGVSGSTLLGGLLGVLGLGLLGAGVASAWGDVATAPDFTPGIPNGVAFGTLTFVVVGLVASQTLGLGLLWPVVALLAAGGVGVGSVLTREDLGVTMPAAGFLLFASAVILGGVIGPSFQWQPSGFSATFTGPVVVPAIALVGSLLATWTSAKAFGGFGAPGREKGANALIGANAATMLALLALIVGFIVSKGFGPMTEGIQWGLYLDFYPYYHFYFPPIEEYVVISGPKLWFYWPFVMEPFHPLGEAISGILPAIVGTIWLVVGAVLFAVPLGVGAAVFLTEYAEKGRFTRLVEVSTNGLWSTPSIVYGLFGLAFLVPRLGNNKSLLAGQLVLGFMLLPLVVITSRESLKSVPDEYRDASAALGVGQWETIKSVVVPAAMPGVITGVILGVGRIAGETAPILLVTTRSPFPTSTPGVLGAFEFTSSPPFVTNPELLDAASALPYQLFAIISAGVGENASFAWGTALVLLIVTLSFYAIGIAMRIYFRRKLHQ
ncbi:phosphate ABC transporter permease PstA [Halobacteriales archaeon Cl-PHB]